MKRWTVTLRNDEYNLTIQIAGITADDSYSAIAGAHWFLHHNPLIQWLATAEEIA